MNACILCGGTRRTVVFAELGVDVVRCGDCEHVYSTFDAPRDYDGYFGDEALDPEGQAYWNQAHAAMYAAFGRRFLAGRAGALLDVGSGLGYFVRYVTTAFPAWRASGIELSPVAVRFARESLGLKGILEGRVEDAHLADGTFDVITLWDVVEHLADPDGVLRCAARLLNAGGVLFLHTPNVSVQLPKARLKRLVRGMRPGVHYLEARDHLNLYSPATIGRLLRRNGFSDVRFTHLPPIQSVAGGTARVAVGLKNLWAAGAAALERGTGGRVNLDNLFVEARR